MPQYRGLVNEGSTCYLNSLLQTLFMTPQFRQNVYNYVHDQRKISATDSIPYQLQKIFVHLQLNQKSVYTKGLLKSFQWDQVDSFQQHDVQQFCRILFEALQKASKGANWIQKLYSGIMQSFISCGKHPRSNKQLFMDISLPIRNQASQKSYCSIEQCLKQYLRPQHLDDRIECQGCGQKVQVEKGLKLLNLPPILTLQVNRFDLNYQTMQREKINTFLYFPEILDMWRFMVPYDKIEIKGLPGDLYERVKLIEKEKSARTTDWGIGGGGNDLCVVGKKIQRKKSFQVEAEKKQIKFYDEENRDKRQDETKKLTPQQQKLKSLQILKDLKADRQKFDSKKPQPQSKQSQKKIQQKSISPPSQSTSVPQPKKSQPAQSLEDDFLFGSFMDGIDLSMKEPHSSNFPQVPIFSSSTPKFQKTEPIFQHVQPQFQPQKISTYPQMTYVLYAILVHSGGAHGGHYYAYIRDIGIGKDWYCFNDNNVRKANREQIRKYGHPSEQSSYGDNAYLLFYRDAKTFNNILNKQPEIPAELLQKVLSDKTPQPSSSPSFSSPSQTRLSQLQSALLLKVHYKSSDLFCISIPDRHMETLSSLKSLIQSELSIVEKPQNWRLRRYNRQENTLHQVYDISENMEKSLDELGLRETCYIGIQVKKDEEKWEEYDPKKIIVKLNVWREGLGLLTESYLRPEKIWVREENSFEQFYKKVQEITGIKNPVIIKRNFSVGNPYQLFTLEANKDKSLLSLRFFNGINLYVEPQPASSTLLCWQTEFLNQKYKCHIKFNSPLSQTPLQKSFQLFIDTRKTLLDLKKLISQQISLPMDSFRIKKSQQSVSEMTAYKKRLTDLKFVNVEYLFIEEGRSAKGTVLIRRGWIEVVDQQIQFRLGDEDQVDIVEGTGQNVSTVGDLKKKIGEKYKISEFNIRVRQLKAHQFAEIFRDTDSLQKLKQKSLVWQQIQAQDPKGLQLYFRTFSMLTLQLSAPFELFLDPSSNYQQLSLLLSQQTLIPHNKLLIHKLLNNFVDKSLLFQPQCEWYEIRWIRRSIREEPLYLAGDGEIFIVKESQSEYHPKVEKKKDGGRDGLGTKEGEGKKKEVGLKITVVEQKEDQKIQNQQNEQKQKDQQKISQKQDQHPETNQPNQTASTQPTQTQSKTN